MILSQLWFHAAHRGTSAGALESVDCTAHQELHLCRCIAPLQVYYTSLPSLGDEPLGSERLWRPAAATGKLVCFLEQGSLSQCSWQWALLGKWKCLVPRVVTFPNTPLPAFLCQKFHLCAPAYTWDVYLCLFYTVEIFEHTVLEQCLSCTNHVRTGHRTKPASALEAVS